MSNAERAMYDKQMDELFATPEYQEWLAERREEEIESMNKETLWTDVNGFTDLLRSRTIGSPSLPAMVADVV